MAVQETLWCGEDSGSTRPLRGESGEGRVSRQGRLDHLTCQPSLQAGASTSKVHIIRPSTHLHSASAACECPAKNLLHLSLSSSFLPTNTISYPAKNGQMMNQREVLLAALPTSLMLMMTANDADDGQESNATVQSFVVRDLGIKPTLPSQAADGDRDGATWYAAAASLVRWGRSCHRDERCVGCDAKRGVCDPRRRRLSDWVGCGRDGVLRGWEGFTSRSCRHRR
ncbi:hypothetical protein IWX46DRAFT_195329 [Phyllosticta citricarpa]|uniref:Uncharacterized protein n=1 Tax=Phyllosticta citricarpa TaxID=55181 RepID=A0ABR1M029_9PEZI